jgi:metallophosphoesterase (TIGR00282 family)
MNILFIGDIVGNPGRDAVKSILPVLRKREKIDFIIANSENAAGGAGITPDIADELLGAGIDVLTNGDHVWDRKEITEGFDKEPRILRPLNYGESAPGRGSIVLGTKAWAKVGVMSLVGRVFMQAVECPFKTAMAEAEKLRKEAPVIIVDMHAEATSEKVALCYYLDGMVTAVCGTHTHIQTADERLFKKGTAFISDAGMTGPFDSVLGRKTEQVIRRFITGLPTRFEVADSDVQLQGVIISCDEKTGKALSIKRVQEKLS